LNKRLLIVVVLAIVVAGAAVYTLQPDRGVPEGAPEQDEMATSIGSAVMDHLFLGHVPGRSGEIMLVPKPHNFLLGEWDLTTLGTNTPDLSTSHPNPWNYLTRVPIIVNWPGVVPRDVDDYSVVDIADLAPTYADVLRMDAFDADGEPLPGLDFSAATRPKLIFTVVIDGGGWNTLQQHPDAWPEIATLAEGGTTYVNATIGSAPSITGALHATFGTGSYPLHHGLPGNQMRGPDGRNTDTWLQNADPRYLKLPTVSELWDEANDNRPVVGTISFEGWHLGMIGHGSQREGGDRDVAALWEVEDNAWWINEDYYELPSPLATTELDRLESYEEELDPRDGVRDGTWFGHTLEELQDERVRPGTPAFVRFTGDAVVDVLRSESIGRDSITDMMWIEMKMPDFAGHAWNVSEDEQEDVLRETDRQIGRFVDELDRTVGRGNYLFAISADHGQQPLPDLYGGWRVNNKELERDIEERFGNVIEKVTPVDIYIDRDEMRARDVSTDEIARYIGTYTIGENIPEGAPGADRVPDARLGETIFAGAFSTEYLAALDAGKIESFGDGDYPEGDFYIDDPGDPGSR
jgi:Type I phosphodiesterase / nucleotide pyrophosphatase